MNWYKKAQSEFDESSEWSFPEADHDYDPAWDYDIESKPEEAFVKIVDEVMKEINEELIPQIGMGKAKEAYIKNNAGDRMGLYIYGTAPHPVFAIDLEGIKKAVEEYGSNVGVAIETTLIHELGHAIQDWMGIPMDGHEAEEFAYQWSSYRQIDNFWEK